MPLIRPATPKDAATMSRIHALSWKAAYGDILPQAYLSQLPQEHWVPFFLHNLGKNGFKAYLSSLKGQAVGCVTFGPGRREIQGARQEGDWGEIYSLYILPEYTGQGQGKALLQHALRQMKDAGQKGCYLWVLQENRDARGFYHAMGFQNDLVPSVFTLMDREITDLRYSKAFPPAGREPGALDASAHRRPWDDGDPRS